MNYDESFPAVVVYGSGGVCHVYERLVVVDDVWPDDIDDGNKNALQKGKRAPCGSDTL